MEGRVELQSVDEVDVTIAVDNFLDVLMPSTEMIRRAPLVWDWAERDTLIAEHGYSLLVTVRKEQASYLAKHERYHMPRMEVTRRAVMAKEGG